MLTHPEKIPHTFELSGLGVAPFKIIDGHSFTKEKKGVFWCEHCGTALKNRYFIKSADNKISIIGIDCLRKTDDQGLIDGAKRFKRETKQKQAEIEREKKLILKQAKEREEFGMTKEEMADKLKIKIDKFIARFNQSIENHPVILSLSKDGFELDMRREAFNINPYSAGKLNVIKKIHTKKISGARVNSKAYKAASTETFKEVDTLNKLLTRKRKSLDKLKGEWLSWLSYKRL